MEKDANIVMTIKTPMVMITSINMAMITIMTSMFIMNNMKA